MKVDLRICCAILALLVFNHTQEDNNTGNSTSAGCQWQRYRRSLRQNMKLLSPNATSTSTWRTTLGKATTLRYDYIIFIRRGSWMRCFFAAIYLSSNFASATCLALLVRFYFSKKYRKLFEKNLNSVCLSLLAINSLKLVNFLRKSSYLDEMLIHANLITSSLLSIAAVDLYLTLKSIVKDVFVEEAANRKRFLLYSICGWLLPIAIVRGIRNFGSDNTVTSLLRQYFGINFAFTLTHTHCALSFVSLVVIYAASRNSYPASRTRTNIDLEAFEAYKYYSDEEYTSNIVRSLSSVRFVLNLLFLVSGQSVALSLLDFFRAYEGMYIYYYLVVDRRKKWSHFRSQRAHTINVKAQHGHVPASISSIPHLSQPQPELQTQPQPQPKL